MLCLVDRYLIRRMLAPALVALVVIVGLVLLLQLLRLGHHFAAALDGRALGELLLLGLPALLGFALPLALLAGVLFGLGRLGDTSQLVALRALGRSPLRLALPALLLGALFAGGAIAAAGLEPAALRRLHGLLVSRAARAVLAALEPGVFQDLGGGATLLVRGRVAEAGGPARFTGLFLARGGAREILVAREARLSLRAASVLALELRDAELQTRNARGGLRRVRMRRYAEELDLGPAIRPHFAFLLRRAAGGASRAATAPCACLALCLVGAVLGLREHDRLRAAGLGALAAGAVLGLGGALEQLGAGPWGPLGLTGAVALLALLALTRR